MTCSNISLCCRLHGGGFHNDFVVNIIQIEGHSSLKLSYCCSLKVKQKNSVPGLAASSGTLQTSYETQTWIGKWMGFSSCNPVEEFAKWQHLPLHISVTWQPPSKPINVAVRHTTIYSLHRYERPTRSTWLMGVHCGRFHMVQRGVKLKDATQLNLHTITKRFPSERHEIAKKPIGGGYRAVACFTQLL